MSFSAEFTLIFLPPLANISIKLGQNFFFSEMSIFFYFFIFIFLLNHKLQNFACNFFPYILFIFSWEPMIFTINKQQKKIEE